LIFTGTLLVLLLRKVHGGLSGLYFYFCCSLHGLLIITCIPRRSEERKLRRTEIYIYICRLHRSGVWWTTWVGKAVSKNPKINILFSEARRPRARFVQNAHGCTSRRSVVIRYCMEASIILALSTICVIDYTVRLGMMIVEY
jgi:hypothetical protein